ncbi:MAG: beta-lactamase family protein [Gammaproteobacteria bacterium]|nr:beta-lactamase family protein [Gammaproteobacteria bacterium]
MNAALLFAALLTIKTPDLQPVLHDMRVAQDVPGVSAVVIRRNEIIFAGASGVADIATGRPMTADTVLYIGSVSKVLTAILALQLVETNTLALDDPVTAIAVDAPDDMQPVRVSHLLTHSAGLEREGDFTYWYTADFPDRRSLANYLEGVQLRAIPGRDLHYSNVGYAALGLVIERATGQSYGKALRSRVLEPLSMNASGAPGPAANVANGYTPSGGMLPNAKRPFAGVAERVGTRHVRMYHDARAMSPAFGAYASASDLARLANFLLGHGGDAVLSRKMRERMRERQDSGWGLGLKLQHIGERPIARHDGWFAAHRTHLLLAAEDDIAIVVLANSDSAEPKRIAEALLAAVIN